MSKEFSMHFSDEICASIIELISSADFPEGIGEISIEHDSVGVEVFPIGLALAPEKLENDKVILRLVDRCAGGGANCYAVYKAIPNAE